MKKLLVGCLVTGLLLLIAGGGAAYWFIWRPIQQAHQAEIQARPFTPNVEGLLTQDQVTKYLVVQNAMYLKLGSDFERIKKKYAEKSTQTDSQSASVGMGDVFGAYQEFAALKKGAKQARTESLNGQKISMAEYTWIHTQVSSAMKVMALGALGDAQKAMTPEDSAVPPSDSSIASTQDVPAAEAPSQNQAQDQAKDALQQAIDAAQAAVKQASKASGVNMSEQEMLAAKKNAELLKPHQAELLKMMVLSVVDMENPMELLGK